MIRRFSINFALSSMVLDGFMVCISLAIATYLRPNLSSLPFAAEFPAFIATPWIVYLVFAVEWVAISLVFSVYDTKRNVRGIDEFISLTLAALLAAVALSGTLYLTYREVSRLLFLVFVVIAYLLMLGWRFCVRIVLLLTSHRPEKQRKVVIVGASATGIELANKIKENPHLGLTILGFIDDGQNQSNNHLEILGSIEETCDIILQKDVNDIVIALPQEAYQVMSILISQLHRIPVKIWVIPDYFRLALHKAAIEEFAGIPLLDLRAPELNEYQRMVKRTFDLVITIALLPIILPLMGIIAMAIRLGSPGKVLLKQPRAGENGRIFMMFKFRTMIDNAEEMRHLVEKHDEGGRIIHKTTDDPRVTRLGRILRRTSLDELPQFFNVLKGDMSLVGPRPELPYLVEQYEPWQRQRFVVPPGMTGWWQIQGRSERPMHLNTDDDLYYVQNHSLLLDIYILVKTIGVVILGKGAY